MALERVAVVGAGLAGLAAALRLKDAGAHVELFERSRLLGGRATSFEIDGVEVDNGQHVFLACCTEFIRFARSVGMEDKLRLQGSFDARVLSRDGKTGHLRAAPLPAPLHLLPSFATYPHLTPCEKLRIANSLVSVSLSKDNVAKTPESFDCWLQRNKQGAGERRAFWDPFFIPALNAPFDKVSAGDALFVLKTAFLHDASAARFGFSTVPLAHLAQAAARRLDAVHTSASVASVEPANHGVTLSLSKGGTAQFDAVVLAVPPRQVRSLLGELEDHGIAGLDAYDPYPIIDVHLWHDAGSIEFDFAAALDSPLQWIFEKTPGYCCCSFSAAEDYLRVPTANLEALAWREAQAFVPALAHAKLVRSAVTRNPEATWLPRIGAQRTPNRTSHPALAIAGSWTDTGWPDTMESAVRSGTAAAEHLLAAQKRPAPNMERRAVARENPGDPTRAALKRAVEWLLQTQSTEGWWSGELETNVTMTAEHVLLCRFLGLPLGDLRSGAIAHILRNQREDGSWALYYDGPADLSTTIEAYVALKVLGVDASGDPMRKTLQVIHRLGGATNARVFTKIWLALFGAYPWSGVPSLPPEIVDFPLWMPFNLYDFACWARGTVAPLTIVVSKRPVRELGVEVGEIFVPGTEGEATRVTGRRHWLMYVERLQKLYEGLPRQPRREQAQERV
ncbi:MAG TPA: hydroxysqualene dehydroxylase HpnE, partial [Candidatus Cybelea sp.]